MDKKKSHIMKTYINQNKAGAAILIFPISYCLLIGSILPLKNGSLTIMIAMEISSLRVTGWEREGLKHI